MSRLSQNKYKVWEDNDSVIEAERKGCRIIARREICTNNWLLRITSMKTHETLCIENIQNESDNFVRSYIETFFSKYKPKKK